MNYLRFFLFFVLLNTLSVLCEPRRGGFGGRGSSRGHSSPSRPWFSSSPSKPSRPWFSSSPPASRPAPRPVSRPSPTPVFRPSPSHPSHSSSQSGKPPPKYGWNVAPPPYTRYVPKKQPPAYGAPSHATRPNPPAYTPSVGHNPYHSQSVPKVSSGVSSSAGNYPRQTYTPVQHFGYPVVNTGYGYGYSSPRVVNNYYSSPGYYRSSGTDNLLTAAAYYNLGRMSSGYHGYHGYHYYNHNYHYNNYRNRDSTTTTEQPTVSESPVLNETVSNANAAKTNIPKTVDLTKQKLFEPILVPFEDVSKHKIDYQPLWLNESVNNAPFYGVEHPTWNETYFVKDPRANMPPEVTGLGAQIGNMFYSLISWFSTGAVNEKVDKTPVYYEAPAPEVITTTSKPLSSEDRLEKYIRF